MRGSAEEVAAEVRAYAELAVEHLALLFKADSPEEFVRAAERFAAEVAPFG
jgi:hypothetical protein